MMKIFGLLSLLVVGCSSQPTDFPIEADTTPFNYTDGDDALIGHIAMPEGDGPFPAVIIIQ